MEETQKKLSYEELSNYTAQLEMRNQRLQQEIAKQNYSNAFTRLEFLFKVLENAVHFSPDFLGDVVKEIETTMTIPEVADSEEA